PGGVVPRVPAAGREPGDRPGDRHRTHVGGVGHLLRPRRLRRGPDLAEGHVGSRRRAPRDDPRPAPAARPPLAPPAPRPEPALPPPLPPRSPPPPPFPPAPPAPPPPAVGPWMYKKARYRASNGTSIRRNADVSDCCDGCASCGVQAGEPQPAALCRWAL